MRTGILIRVGVTSIILAHAFFFVLAALDYSDLLLRASGIPEMKPFFADLRTIPALEHYESLEKFRSKNPTDPWGRPFNYPKVWVYLIAAFRVCSDPYFCFGSMQFAAYLLFAVVLVWRVASPYSSVAIAVFALSPPVTLLLERGNTDGTVFLLVLSAVIWRGAFRTPFLIALAGGLKLFPMVALPVAFVAKKWMPFVLAVAVTSPLLVSAIADVWAIQAATSTSAELSFGVSSFSKLLERIVWETLGARPSHIVLKLTSVGFFATVASLALFMFRPAYRRLSETVCKSSNELQIFLVFGVIFLATLVLASNWAYRIVFLSPVAFFFIRLLIERRAEEPSDFLLLVGLNTATIGAFWSFLGPYGHLLFNVATFFAAAMLFPMVAICARNSVVGDLED